MPSVATPELLGAGWRACLRESDWWHTTLAKNKALLEEQQEIFRRGYL
ncbi:hypothetical protein B0G80_2026 [Paraburkholderia sp. BL6669N2]|jgi:hypothetical protein|nr:hypothetical protein B0G80_2026 [Paraburkholderia sp. BL6669N2]